MKSNVFMKKCKIWCIKSTGVSTQSYIHSCSKYQSQHFCNIEKIMYRVVTEFLFLEGLESKQIRYIHLHLQKYITLLVT